METKTERLRALVERMLERVPEELWETGMLPMLRIPANQDTVLEDIGTIEWSDTWPYQQTTINGRTVGVHAAGAQDPDLLAVYWPSAENENGMEERRLYLPAGEMTRSQYEIYLRLRRDGTSPERAAELAEELA